jgi:hypothetical protein
MPKILCDTEKDCGKPGCPNDHRSQVLARGDEMVEQEWGFPPLAHRIDIGMSVFMPLLGAKLLGAKRT